MLYGYLTSMVIWVAPEKGNDTLEPNIPGTLTCQENILWYKKMAGWPSYHTNAQRSSSPF